MRRLILTRRYKGLVIDAEALYQLNPEQLCGAFKQNTLLCTYPSKQLIRSFVVLQPTHDLLLGPCAAGEWVKLRDGADYTLSEYLLSLAEQARVIVVIHEPSVLPTGVELLGSLVTPLNILYLKHR